MSNEIEATRTRTPVARKLMAGAVLAVVGVLVVTAAIAFVKAILWTVVIIVGVVAVLWALKTLVW